MSTIDLNQDRSTEAQIRKDESIASFLDFIKVPTFALLATSAVLVPVWLLTNL